MHSTTLLKSFVALAATSYAGYTLEDDYMSAGFFDQFSFWDQKDPTNGFVAYQSKESSMTMGLINSTDGNIKMSVDSTNQTPNGRPSVRISSNKSYNQGLVVVDIEHMPGGICGTWPAFWLLGPNWPNGGEIDIFEGVHDQTENDITLHTGPSCQSITNTQGFSGTLKHTTCLSSGDSNTGCQIGAGEGNTYGAGFNANGGGLYATEWTTESISVWFFPRSSIPSDALGHAPNPSTWGTPLAKFVGGNDCDMTKSFSDQQIVFDTTFCGDWAGNTWSQTSCAQMADTCEAYVENNPAAFKDAYWSVNALKVYTNNGNSSPEPSSILPSVSIPGITLPNAASTVIATATSIVYVPHPGLSTTFAVSTKSSSNDDDSGYAPIVGPSGGVNFPAAPSSAAPSAAAPSSAPESQGGGGWAPVVGTNGMIFGQDTAAPAQSGGWSNDANGAAIFNKREEQQQQRRHMRHMAVHKRHGTGARL